LLRYPFNKDLLRFPFSDKKAGNAVPNGNANHLEVEEAASVEPAPPAEKAPKGKKGNDGL